MNSNNRKPGGMPYRLPRRVRPRGAAVKLSVPHPGQVTPMRVRVEVQSGRGTTANIMRAYRVLQRIEKAGGTAQIIQVAADGSTLVAEVEAAKVEGLAELPFIRRIVSLN